MSTELHKYVCNINWKRKIYNKQISRKTRAKQRTSDIQWWQRVANLKTENP